MWIKWFYLQLNGKRKKKKKSKDWREQRPSDETKAKMHLFKWTLKEK